MNTLKELQDSYQNTSEWNEMVNETFITKTNDVKELKALRDFVEQNAFGFGERAFYQMWSMIIDEMPQTFSFLEIGVFRGQTLALIRMLANLKGKECKIVGVTPLDTTDGHWESNYAEDIDLLHASFNIEQPKIIKGLSTDEKIIKQIKNFDIVYIDGGHEYEVVKSDLENYCNKAKKYLVIDDCANRFNLKWGMFAGIEPVSKAVDEYLPPFTENNNFTYICNVIHNRIWKRNK